MFSGHGFEWLSGVGPGEELVDLALRMSGDDAADDVGEVGLGIDRVELAGLNERGDRCPVLAAPV